MSELRCELKTLSVIPHPNADRLEIAKVDGYDCVTMKGRYSDGDVAIYVPENAIVPDDVLKIAGYWNKEKNEGLLSGSKKNRVKPITLRGVLSEGILIDPYLFPHISSTKTDFTEALGITKYTPKVPSLFNAPKIRRGDERYVLSFDFDNIKSHPNNFSNEDAIEITEKIHGSLCALGIHFPNGTNGIQNFGEHSFFCSSKGLLKNGVIIEDIEENKDNVYYQMLQIHKEHFLNGIYGSLGIGYYEYDEPVTFILLGEVYGTGVQDLNYGISGKHFRAYELFHKKEGDKKYHISGNFQYFIAKTKGIQMVPYLYRGYYDERIVKGFVEGNTYINDAHMREGIVIKLTSAKRFHTQNTRLKYINPAYLMRKNGTEYN